MEKTLLTLISIFVIAIALALCGCASTGTEYCDIPIPSWSGVVSAADPHP